MHARRDDLADRPNTVFKLKIIQDHWFADNLDMGRWNSDLMENERTENRPVRTAAIRSHPNQPTPQDPDWTRVQRGLCTVSIPASAPYVCHGWCPSRDKKRLLPQFFKTMPKTPSVNKANVSVWEQQTWQPWWSWEHVHRIQHHEDDAFKPFQIPHDIFWTPQSEIGTLDLLELT